MFIFTGIGLLIISSIIFFKDNETESTRWLATLCLFAAIGEISVVWDIGGILGDTAYYMVPYCALIYGLSNIVKSYKRIVYILFFIPSLLSFYYLNSLGASELYFRELSFWSVPYILCGVFFTVYSYLKEELYLIKKHKFINTIILAPCLIYICIVNFILRCFNINTGWRIYPIIFLLQFLAFIYFACKYGIFGVTLKFDRHKFAFENIIEFTIEPIVVVDQNLRIKDVNKVFLKTFKASQNKKYKNLRDIIMYSNLKEYESLIVDIIEECKIAKKSIKTNIKVSEDLETNYFEVHVNNVIVKEDLFGTVVLFRNITEHKKNVELMIEGERLRSLSELIGGVAHNFKTPLMSVSGGLLIIENDIDKLQECINQDNNKSDMINSINEISIWQDRCRENLTYMAEIIDTIKGQLKEIDSKSYEKFLIKDIVTKVTILMDFKLKQHKCKLIKKIDINENTQITGNVNSLIQIINNIMDNAIEASKDDRIILWNIFEENQDNIILSIKNFGEQIPFNIQRKLFNNMITTKGKNGTGLGLYISNLIVRSKFKGSIYFKSDKKETVFFIKLPKEIKNE